MTGLRTPYKLSGHVGGGLLAAPLVGLVAAAVGSIVYAYVDVYSPVVGVISALFVLGLGFGVGAAVSWVARAAHTRNVAFLYCVGFAVGLVALYLSWVDFEWVLLRKGGEEIGFGGLVALTAQPAVVWEIARSIAETGWFTIGSAQTNISGVMLWLIWGVEAVCIVGLTTFSSAMMVDGGVYCEANRTWLPKWPNPPRLLPPEDEGLVERLIQGDLDAVEQLEAAADDQLPRVKVEVWSLPDATHTAAFQLKLELPKVEKEKVSIQEKDLSPQYLATPDDIRRLEALVSAT